MPHSVEQSSARWDMADYRPFEGSPEDLDAVSGPQEEVAAIRRHWAEQDRLHRGRQPQGAAPPPRARLLEPPQQHEEVEEEEAPAPQQRPQPRQQPPPPPKRVDPAEGAAQEGPRTVASNYRKWDNFDADAAELEVDNSDRKDPEEAATMVRATAGGVGIQCVDYKKDREEFDLDKELQHRTQDLQSSLTHRLKLAGDCNDRGNAAMDAGKKEPAEGPQKFRDALAHYTEGLEVLQFCVTAKVLMAPGLVEKLNQLLVPLTNNAAQAALFTKDWQAAERHASAGKARYELWKEGGELSCLEEARADLQAAHKCDRSLTKLLDRVNADLRARKQGAAEAQ
eukprot:TRINITY_DN8731_c0_g1_i1.p2 TRINITY_DN8731_c0_g1~~TRINITY_DN8731_c0_g1_i1.p2  ORF type:complete len:339 (+),score=118.49 TRINITY_DN8731_c0_g1_i1:81-1097(+)